jgi:hypothetical protein
VLGSDVEWRGGRDSSTRADQELPSYQSNNAGSVPHTGVGFGGIGSGHDCLLLKSWLSGFDLRRSPPQTAIGALCFDSVCPSFSISQEGR